MPLQGALFNIVDGHSAQGEWLNYLVETKDSTREEEYIRAFLSLNIFIKE